MKMKSKNQRLAEYASLALAFLSIHDIKAQAVYTDIEPDIILEENNDFAAIDIDNNGFDDFAFKNEFVTVYDYPLSQYVIRERIWAGWQVTNQNVIAGIADIYWTVSSDSWYRYYPYALSEGANINDTLIFQHWGFQRMAFRSYLTDFNLQHEGGYWYPEVLDHYLGVRFIDSESQNHYGWIRCSVLDSGRTLIIHDYAYEIQPDSAIAAGDTTGIVTDIHDTENLYASVYSFNNIIYIHISNEPNETIQLNIYDVTGKCIHNQKINNPTTEIKMDEKATGIYLVELIADKAKLTKKVILH